MTFSVIIPARYSSQRLPGKPLLDIAGTSLIERVYRCAGKSKATRVIVATDDQRIAEKVENFGGEVCMTSTDHNSGTDRLQEVASILNFSADEIVVNVQGDEPLIPASVINQVAENLINNTCASCATLCELIERAEDCFNPNVVKVVSDTRQMALYFSRAPIPWHRDNFSAETLKNKEPVGSVECYRHIGIYAYRVSLLHEFVSWPLAPLEQLEKLEQLRILANSRAIHVDVACAPVPGGVDTLEDLQRLNQLLSSKS